jgi:hypothetical protein
VNGSIHQGTRICFGLPSNAQIAKLQSLAPGDKVQVKVNPKNPDEVVVLPGITFGAKAFVVLGGFGTVFICTAFITILASKKS